MVLQIRYTGEGAGCVDTPVRLPLSKSMALRMMMLNAVADRQGRPMARLTHGPETLPDDVEGLRHALQSLSERPRHNEIYIGEGGAPMRFFAAFAASVGGTDIVLTGSDGLCRRPMAILIDTLREAGARIECLAREGYPPLHISGATLSPAALGMNPGVSSQYISALMLASPLWESPLDLRLEGGATVSTPYLRMTADLMRRWGAEVTLTPDRVSVGNTLLASPESVEIEADWSAASYFYSLALLLPDRKIQIARLTPPERSLQGDSACAAIFGLLGVNTDYKEDSCATLSCDRSIRDAMAACREPLQLDMGATPDLVPALAVAMCLAGIRFRLFNIAHLKHKESDRLTALANELQGIGYRVEAQPDALLWDGGRYPVGEDIRVETYGDHRMAMAFASAAALLPYIAVEDPMVVDKSYPDFWDNLESLGFQLKSFGQR